jgi:hypothetical protein
MRTPDMTHDTLPESRIVAKPPSTQPPFDPKQPLPVSQTRVCIGLVLLVIASAVGLASSFFDAAKLLLFAATVVLMMCSFFVLGLHRMRTCGRGRDPRKLYGHQRI